VPVTPTTIDVAERGGRDLRRLLVACVPYVTILVALLVPRERNAPGGAMRLTSDMYGLKLWQFEREVGGLLEVVESIATKLKLTPVKGVPKSLRHAPEHLTEKGSDVELLGIMLVAGILREKGTTFELAPGFEDELREGSDANPSLMEKLRVVQEMVR
jgi:hypothetical protein